MTATASADTKADALRLLGLADDPATVDLVQLANGATGLTFGLKRNNGARPEGAPAFDYVVRELRTGEADKGLVAVTKALSDVQAGAKFVAASERVLIVEFVRDAAAPTVAQLSDSTVALAQTAQVLAKLHSTKTATLGDAVDVAEKELEKWLSKAAALHQSDEKQAFMAAVAAEVAAASAMVERAAAAAPVATWLRGDRPAHPNCVLAHGDFHPNNVLLPAAGAAPPIVVDLEHTALRPAAFDVAYFFHVWGDMRFTVPGRFAPSAHAPVPYAEHSARVAFVKTYLTERHRHTDDSEAPMLLTDAAIDALATAFLWEVEQVGYLERLRLLLVWLVIAGVATGGVGAQLYGGAVMYLPAVSAARELLAAAQADPAKQAALVEHGAIVQGMVAHTHAAHPAAP